MIFNYEIIFLLSANLPQFDIRYQDFKKQMYNSVLQIMSRMISLRQFFSHY